MASRKPPVFPAGLALLLAALFSVQGAGCAARRPAEDPRITGPLLTPDVFYRSLQERDARRLSLEGTARFRIHTGERKARLDVSLLCERPGSLRFDANDFLDHLLFLAVVREGVISSYSVPENLYNRGPASPSRIRDLLGVSLPPEALVSMLLGSPFLVSLTDPALRLYAAGEHDLLAACEPSGDLCTTVRVDRRGRPVESLLEILPGEGREPLRIRVTFSKYRSVDSVDFPFRIHVLDEGSGRYFQLDFHEINLNRELPADLFDFDPPQGAERQTW